MTPDTPTTLRDVAIAASQRVGGLQGRALDREAKRRGLTLSYTTVDKIIAGTYNSRPKATTLRALAELSGIALAQVYQAAGEPMPSVPLSEMLPPDADLLSPDQRRVVIDVVRQFAKQNRELVEVRKEVAASAEHPAPIADTSKNTLTVRGEPLTDLEGGPRPPTDGPRADEGSTPHQEREEGRERRTPPPA
jgi:hypothetical protein